MAEFIKAAKAADVPVGSMKTVIVNGKSITLANIDGTFFAIGDTCTHHQCSLGTEGFLEGSTVTCGCHGAQFDVKTGKVLALPAPTDEPSYPVKVVGEDILIQA